MEAFVTLATSDDYAVGALVLAASLRKVNTTKHLCIMVSDNVSAAMLDVLHTFFDSVVFVNVLDSNDAVNLALLSRPDLGVTFTKLHCWRLTQFTKAVFLDADILVLKNIDDLFCREEFSAAPDPGWPDCFNSGVYVYSPSLETYSKLLELAQTVGSFDGGDQGLLNQYFSDWSTKDISRHLSCLDNCMSQIFYSYLPAMKYYQSKIRVVHFIGPIKPWKYDIDTATGVVRSHVQESVFLQYWWSIFLCDVKDKLENVTTALAQKLSKLHVSSEAMSHAQTVATSSASGVSDVTNDRARQYAWERGEIDYSGVDSFDNILSKMMQSINK